MRGQRVCALSLALGRPNAVKPAVFFRGYRFEHPKTENSVTVRGWSYVWAGLLGAGYVAWIGQGNVWKALAINIAYGVFAVGTIFLASVMLPALTAFFVILVLVPSVVIAQGVAMIRIIHAGFRRRGWFILQG